MATVQMPQRIRQGKAHFSNSQSQVAFWEFFKADC